MAALASRWLRTFMISAEVLHVKPPDIQMCCYLIERFEIQDVCPDLELTET